MIPRLEAEDALLASKVVAVGTGALKNPREISDEWERIRRGDPPSTSTRRTRKPALFSDEVFARLPVVRVPRKKG